MAGNYEAMQRRMPSVGGDPGGVTHDPTDNQPGGLQGLILQVLSKFLQPGGVLSRGVNAPPTPVGSGDDPLMGVISAMAQNVGPENNLDPARSFQNMERARTGAMAGAPEPTMPHMDMLPAGNPMRAMGSGAPADMRDIVGQGDGDPEGSSGPPSNLDPYQSYKNMYGPRADNSQTAVEGNPIADMIAAMMGGDTGTPETPGMVSRDYKPPTEGEMDAADQQYLPPSEAEMDTADEQYEPPIQGKVQEIDPGSVMHDSRDTGGPGGVPDDETQETAMGTPATKGGRYTGSKSKASVFEPKKAIEDNAMAMAKDQSKNERGREGNYPSRGSRSGSIERDTKYKVVNGDSLSKIAARVYGDANRWKEIARANGLNIKNPNKILTGQTIVLPGRGKPRNPTQRPFRGYGGGAHQ